MDLGAGQKRVPRPLTLLLVNDEADGLFLLEHALKREFPGAATICCRSASEAVNVLADRPVDGVITDNRMPAVTGMELVRSIRAKHRDLPVVMLTGSEEKRREAFEAGVNAFISGGDWREIRHEIRRAIESASHAPTPDGGSALG